MGVKQIIQLESDSVTEQTIRIPFRFPDKSSLPEGKEIGDSIVISPITVRTWFKLKPLLLKIEKNDLDKIKAKGDYELDKEIPEIMSKYDTLLLDIVCIGIHNKRHDPPAWFKEVLKDNSTWQDIYILLNAILFRIGYNPFCKSITIVKNVSPMKEQEIIACQNNEKSWQNL